MPRRPFSPHHHGTLSDPIEQSWWGPKESLEGVDRKPQQDYSRKPWATILRLGGGRPFHCPAPHHDQETLRHDWWPRPVPSYQGLLNNRHFFVQLKNKKSKGKAQKTSVPQGRPLDWPLSSWMSPPSTNYFPYNAAISSMLTTSASPLNRRIPEDRAWSALQELTTFNNHLKCNPSKTQLCCFPLRNLENKWVWMKVSWDGHQLPSPSSKTYLQKTKAKVNTCNNIQHKLENWLIHQPSVPLP